MLKLIEGTVLIGDKRYSESIDLSKGATHETLCTNKLVLRRSA